MATTAAHELSREPDGGLILSVEAIWQHALALGAAGPAGTSLGAMKVALMHTGQPAEDLWPFDPSNYDRQMVPRSAGSPPWLCGTVESHIWNSLDVVASIRRGEAVVAVVDVTDAFVAPDHNAVIPDPEPEDVGQGLHAVVCVAAGWRGRTLYILIRNSWGTGWGQAGYAWMSATHFNAMVRQTASVKHIALPEAALPYGDEVQA